ncbi:MAG TPA: hypothetical protein VFR41_07335 [Acidimicrobiia bacterium]|nr:hypothetical protein [Acidimicrobiia bacterium]
MDRPLFTLLAVAALGACSSGSSSTHGPVTSVVAGATTTAPVVSVTVHGRATLDGRPFDAPFLGAMVRKGGLATPCQADVPAVRAGQFEIAVLAAPSAAGCGESGADIVLWTFLNNRQYFATRSTPWPASSEITFDPVFRTATPMGLAPPRTEFAGQVFAANGAQVDHGRVEALVGETVCGVASIRTSGDFVGFSLASVGPSSIPACARNAPLHFTVNGRPAANATVNDLRTHRSFDLVLE